MARKEAPPEAEHDEDDNGRCRVWGEVKINLRLGEYEGLVINLGESRECDDNPKARKAVRKSILKECEAVVVSTATRVRQEYQDSL